MLQSNRLARGYHNSTVMYNTESFPPYASLQARKNEPKQAETRKFRPFGRNLC